MPFLNLTSYHSSPFSPLFPSPFVHFLSLLCSLAHPKVSWGVIPVRRGAAADETDTSAELLIDLLHHTHTTTPTIHSSTQLGKPNKTHTIHLIYMTILFFCSTLYHILPLRDSLLSSLWASCRKATSLSCFKQRDWGGQMDLFDNNSKNGWWRMSPSYFPKEYQAFSNLV